MLAASSNQVSRDHDDDAVGASGISDSHKRTGPPTHGNQMDSRDEMPTGGFLQRSAELQQLDDDPTSR